MSEPLLYALSQGTMLTEALPCSNCGFNPHHGSLYGSHWKAVQRGESRRAAWARPGSSTQDSVSIPLAGTQAHGYLTANGDQLCAYKKGDVDSVE